MHGKCPKCEALITRVSFQEIEAVAPQAKYKWRTITFICPFCSVVLGVQMDPIALKSDTVAEVLTGLGRG